MPADLDRPQSHIAARPKILAVDDDLRMRESIRQLLAMNGYRVESVASGAEARERLATDHFDVVLLDLRLGDMSGHEVLDFITEQGVDATVIVVFGDTSIDSAIDSLRRGAHDFIRKPYAAEELVTRLENALSKRRLQRDHAQIRERLRKSEELYRYMVNSSPDIVYMLDEHGCFTFVNDKVESVLGVRREQLLGEHYSAIVYGPDLDRLPHVFNERRTGDRATRNAELRLRRQHRRDGHQIDEDEDVVAVELNAMGVYSHDAGRPRFLGTYGVARDISERKRAEKTILYQAYHDLLTGLPNRTLFKDHLNLALAQAARNSQLLAVMFLDLDRFKVVNDTLGHGMGDRLLRLVSRRLHECLRGGDTLARIGGDEFLLLLPQVKGRTEAQAVARKIIDALRAPFLVDGYELYVGCSIGISVYPDDGDSHDTLIKNADVAMYHVKGSGKGSYQFYSDSMEHAFSRHLSIEGELRKAIEGDQLRVFFQPQVSALDGRIVGVEALIRWEHPTFGLLPPSEFIPIAEETGCIASLGEWMLHRVCDEVRGWRDAGLPPIRVSVNLSALEVVHQRFVETVLAILAEYDLPGECLEIEITENIIMKDLKTVADKLRRLSLHGIKVAIDDFGTGYSSLSYLKKLPIHTLKIDRSFIHDMAPSSQDDGSIVAAIVSMAKGLGLNLIAEGVETAYQRERLAALGCPEMQGFLFTEPVNHQRTTELLRRGLIAA